MSMRIALLVAAALALAGCAGNTSRSAPLQVFPDMDRQAKRKPQSASSVFADRRSSRPPVEGTVARGFLEAEDALYKGVVNNQYVGRNPLPVDQALMQRGQMRFNTYCSPCHDRTGSGRGLVGQKDLWLATSLHEDRIKQMNDGEIFTIVTNGRRSMPAYKYQILASDRWAIVAYVRALQRTTSSALDEVPEDQRAGLR